jgi:SAM-dependent methyltransferase
MPISNTPTNRYGSIAAEIYDIDKPVGAMPDTAYFSARLAGVSGAILEPGCGSGRALVPLLAHGFDITGFDASPEMLSQCRARCAAHGFSPDLSLQRFEDFTYDRRFAAIFMPVGSFTLIDDFAVAMDVLARFRTHLEPGGRLLLDIQPLSYLAHLEPDRRRWTSPAGDLLTLEGVRLNTDWPRQRAEYVIRYERWRDNRLVESQIEPMSQRYWGVEEFRLALAAAGFGSISITANYASGRAAPASPRVLTYEARSL